MNWRDLIEETEHEQLGLSSHRSIDGVDYHVDANEIKITLQPANFKEDREAGTPVFFEIVGKAGFITTDQAMAIGMAFIKAAQQELRRTES